MKNLCIIPAKSFSKRLPSKNIKFFFGKPVISYSITTALKSKLFTKVFVSTESEKVAKISKKFGADVDFLRPKNLAKSEIPIINVVKDVIKKFEKKYIFFDYVCCLFPVAPLLKEKHLRSSLNKIRKSKLDFIFPATKRNGSNQNYFHINKKFSIIKILKSKKNKTNTKIYSDAGQFYWGKTKVWKNNKSKIIEKKSGVVIFDENLGIDVNFLKDWNLLKKEYKKKYANKM